MAKNNQNSSNNGLDNGLKNNSNDGSNNSKKGSSSDLDQSIIDLTNPEKKTDKIETSKTEGIASEKSTSEKIDEDKSKNSESKDAVHNHSKQEPKSGKVTEKSTEHSKTDKPVNVSANINTNSKTNKNLNEKAAVADMASDNNIMNDKTKNQTKNQDVKSDKSSQLQQPKSGGSGVASLALLLGAIGVGIGGYNYMELKKLPDVSQDISASINQLKTDVDNTINKTVDSKLASAKSSLEAVIKSNMADDKPIDTSKFATMDNVSDLNSKIIGVDSQIQSIANQINELRNSVANFEQNSGQQAAENNQGAEDTAINPYIKSESTAEINNKLRILQQNYSDLQQQLQNATAKISSEMKSAATSVDTDKIKNDISVLLKNDLSKSVLLQSVYQTLNQAQYQLSTLHDVASAEALLTSAMNKLGDGYDKLKQAINEQINKLKSSNIANKDELLKNVAEIKSNVSNLQPKTAKASEVVSQDNAAQNGFADKAMNLLKDSVKYTPASNEINVSKETALIQQRLMQSDINILQYAVLTSNQDLLVETANSLAKSLNATFADNSASKIISTNLTSLKNANLRADDNSLESLTKMLEQQMTANPSAAN